MTRKDFFRTTITIINADDVSKEEVTRAEVVCIALQINDEEYHRLFKKFSEQVNDVEERWEEIEARIIQFFRIFNRKEITKEQYIELLRPQYKEMDHIKWYSKEAMRIYCEAMNYEL